MKRYELYSMHYRWLVCEVGTNGDVCVATVTRDQAPVEDEQRRLLAVRIMDYLNACEEAKIKAISEIKL